MAGQTKNEIIKKLIILESEFEDWRKYFDELYEHTRKEFHEENYRRHLEIGTTLLGMQSQLNVIINKLKEKEDK